MARSRRSKSSDSAVLKTVHSNIDEEIAADMQTLALLLGITASELVERALRAEIEAVKKAPPRGSQWLRSHQEGESLHRAAAGRARGA